VYTPLHGSGNVPVRRALKEAGIVNVTVVPEQEKPDPDFPTVKAPNPEDPDAFRLGVALAREVGASVVFATDPDCDRLGASVKDNEGVFRTLTGNQIGCLLLHHILQGKRQGGSLPQNGAVVKSFVTTQMAQVICDDYGVTLFETMTGFKYIGELIEGFERSGDYQFLFGFEESFGYLSGTQVRDKDAVNASLLIAEAACACMAQGKTLYEKMQELYEKYGYYLEDVLAITLPGKDGLEDMKRIMEELRANPPLEIGGFQVLGLRDYLTGLRIAGGKKLKLDYPTSDALYFELEDGHWCAVRPSGTEPKIKLYVNTASRESMEDAKALNVKLMADMKAQVL
ncbi:MAG: phospho-sugar mutase, partial [Clostridiales bacterium]|nr:phospho-sugar mutase [Clostridiales bacterium]